MRDNTSTLNHKTTNINHITQKKNIYTSAYNSEEWSEDIRLSKLKNSLSFKNQLSFYGALSTTKIIMEKMCSMMESVCRIYM